MNEPVVTACACTPTPTPLYADGQPRVLLGGVVVCPSCGRHPFGVDPQATESEET